MWLSFVCCNVQQGADSIDHTAVCPQVDSCDAVLELGCSYGVCTSMLAEHCQRVIGIDNSAEVVQEARRRYPRLQFHLIDVLSEPVAVLELAQMLSGSRQYRSSDSTGLIASQYPTVEACSSALQDGNCTHNRSRVYPSQASHAGSGTAHGGGSKASSSASTGQAAMMQRNTVSVVFADIGGNRQLAALIRLVPWILQHLQPRLLVVKSKELAAAAAEELLKLQQANSQQHVAQHSCCHQEQGHRDQGRTEHQQQQPPVHGQQWQQQGGVYSSNHQQQHEAPAHAQQAVQCCHQSGCSQQHDDMKQNAPIAHAMEQICAKFTNQRLIANAQLPTYGLIAEAHDWWQKLEGRCDLQAFSPQCAKHAESWFLAARAKGFVKNPLRYPQRYASTGTRICRPHNYDQCFKHETCPFDHIHCHHCGSQGHRAVHCTILC
eukprot:GHRR01028266.1.p1 GENE.GHRR01028266.1~~GHRR01028266.1.p1  ORF type:complete len:434 (+),score=133.59 GHRR01028266.1:775-2076(+)